MSSMIGKKVDPPEVLSTMYSDLRKSKDLLLQLRELSTYSTILNAGERESIQHLLSTIDIRMNFIREIQICL